MDFLKRFSALIISLLLLLMAIFLFLKHIANVSLPDENEEYNSVQINSTVKIFRNSYGIPHIVAANENDLFFAVGYAHAQDRLWQMDYFRRIAKGRLSEIFGKTSLNIDVFMRTIEIEKTATDIKKRISKKTLELLQSYSDGINFYINQNKTKLPYEFCVFDYIPDSWSPVDCIIIQRLIALELSVSFWSDITNGAIAERLGPIRTLELIPSYPNQSPCVLDSSYPVYTDKKRKQIQKSKSDSIDYFSIYSLKYDVDKTDLLIQLGKEFNDIRNRIGMIGNSKGSNAWAIKKEKLNQSHAILANDAHMPLGLPAIWYQIHESCPSFNSIGLTIPGIPFIFTGRNNYIAWGFSNMNLDDCDFFVEKVDADTNYYFNSEGNRIRFKYVRDTIKIKNNENYTYYRKYSNRSAILKKYVNIKNLYKIIGNEKSNVYKSFHKKYNITFDWIGRRISNELDALYKLNSTKNWQQFRQALSLWGVPSVNYLYADIYGNIGLVPTGILPAREKECKPQIPNPGWITGYGWLGTKTFSNIPMLYNPPKKFVSASNNKLWRYSSDYISSYWESSSRIQRIDNLLSLYNEYNSREAQIMQLDVYSSFAKEILDLTIPIIQKSPGKLEELHRKSLRRLKKWDFQMSQQSASPIIFSQFMLKLIQNTFKDELGENLYKQFISASNLPFRRIIELVADSVSSSWFDNIRTNLYEDKDYIIQKSYTDAVDELKSMYGTDNINLWFYGVNNTIKLEHILSFYSLINPAINLQSFECGGSNTTINTMEWDMSEPYKIVSGTSMRFIADMGDNLVYTSIAGGISGDPFSDYYSNQVQLWLNGGYIALPVSNEPGSSFKQVTEFNPAKR